MKIQWDKTGEKLYETGIDRVCLYLPDSDNAYKNAYPWNGVTGITESPSGAEATALWADNQKYLNLISAEEFGATIEAYTYPAAWEECDGSKELAPGVLVSQQNRKSFGLSYRTILGNDVKNNDYGYKIHLVYGGLASPSQRGYSTVNDSPEAITFSWEIKTTPVNVSGAQATARLTIDSTKVSAEQLAALEAILYGTEDDDAYLPTPDAIITMFKSGGAAPLSL